MIPVAFKSRPEKDHQPDVVLVSTMFFENHAWFSENSQFETVITKQQICGIVVNALVHGL